MLLYIKATRGHRLTHFIIMKDANNGTASGARSMDQIDHWLDQRAAVPLIQALNRQADDWGAAELARARKALARGEAADKVLEALARGITNKLLHGTLAELHAAEGDERQQLADTVSRLFLRQGGKHGNGRASSGDSGR